MFDSDAIDQESLLRNVYNRSEELFVEWKKKASLFKCGHFMFTLLVVIIQVIQIVLLQMPSPCIPRSAKISFTTILAALTGTILAIQIKLKWDKKARKCRKTANVFRKLRTHAEYRLKKIERGEAVKDSLDIWNTALRSEMKDVPSFLLPY